MRHRVILFLLLSALFFWWPGANAASAASAALYFSPSSEAYAVGETFSVGVYASSPEAAMNAASGTITFSKNTLEVVSLSKSGSIFNFWAQEPALSKEQGTVQFEGIVVNPGFTGASGNLLTVTFKTKAVGDGSLTFSSGAVLANDGRGTNIISSLGSARFNVSVPTTGPAASRSTSPETAGLPAAPEVTSPTHPDPTAWYAKRDPRFEWLLPTGVTGVNVLADRDPTTNPGTRSDGLRTSWGYENVEGGVWYFHIRARNERGWGAISHFRFQIDTKPPEPFSLALLDGRESQTPRPRIAFETTDAPSGVAYYEIKVDGAQAIRAHPEEVADGKPYLLPPQTPGQKLLVVRAFDYAGNMAVATEEFNVHAIEAPTITEYPKELAEGEVLRVRGTTYSGSKVAVSLEDEHGRREDEEAVSDAEGAFTVIWPSRLKSGLYQISARVTDESGAQSELSEALTFEVRPRVVLKIGSLVVTYLSVLVTLIAILALLVAVSLYSWYRFGLFRRNLKKEIKEAEEELHRDVDGLRRRIVQQVRTLESAHARRRITAAEKKAVRQLKAELDAMEARVGKEIEDIEEEVK